MFLVELFMRLSDIDGERFSHSIFDEIERILTDRFGALTSYPRAPASGIWTHASGSAHDELVVYEVMAEKLDKRW